MENFWTSQKPINGLRHFILVNQEKKEGQNIYLLVSVVDVEIFLKITHEALNNSADWVSGWLDLPKIESVTQEYIEYKSISNEKNIDKIFVSEDSLFNIS